MLYKKRTKTTIHMNNKMTTLVTKRKMNKLSQTIYLMMKIGRKSNWTTRERREKRNNLATQIKTTRNTRRGRRRRRGSRKTITQVIFNNCNSLNNTNHTHEQQQWQQQQQNGNIKQFRTIYLMMINNRKKKGKLNSKRIIERGWTITTERH